MMQSGQLSLTGNDFPKAAVDVVDKHVWFAWGTEILSLGSAVTFCFGFIKNRCCGGRQKDSLDERIMKQLPRLIWESERKHQSQLNLKELDCIIKSRKVWSKNVTDNTTLASQSKHFAQVLDLKAPDSRHFSRFFGPCSELARWGLGAAFADLPWLRV